jgi:hypothetical protein
MEPWCDLLCPVRCDDDNDDDDDSDSDDEDGDEEDDDDCVLLQSDHSLI